MKAQQELRPPVSHVADLPNAFDWVDDYFAHIRPRFDVREEDQLLIVLPNRAVKLNRSGLAILRFLKDGGEVASCSSPSGRPRSGGAICSTFCATSAA